MLLRNKWTKKFSTQLTGIIVIVEFKFLKNKKLKNIYYEC